MIALLNAPVMTGFGDFRYEPLSEAEVKLRLVPGNFVSYIGHEATCRFLSQKFAVQVPYNRTLYRQQPGDVAIVFHMLGRSEEGVIINSPEELEARGYQFGMITRLT